MKLTLLFSALVACSFLSNLRVQGDNLYRNSLQHCSQLVKVIKSKFELVKNSLMSRKSNDKKIKEEEEPDSEQIREFLDQISKHFKSIQDKNKNNTNVNGEDANDGDDINENVEEDENVEEEDVNDDESSQSGKTEKEVL
jgi:hypothetical protein